MHGFGLVIGSILGHKWARAVVKQAQRLVTFFRASHKAIKFLRLAAIARKITKLLRTANATRFTSVANMLDSVLGLEQALLAVASEHPDIFRARSTKSKSKQKGAQNAESNGVLVLQTIQSRTFWAKLEPLCQLLDPLTRVTQAVQAADATLASVFRYSHMFFLAMTACRVCISGAFHESVSNSQHVLPAICLICKTCFLLLGTSCTWAGVLYCLHSKRMLTLNTEHTVSWPSTSDGLRSMTLTCSLPSTCIPLTEHLLLQLCLLQACTRR